MTGTLGGRHAIVIGVQPPGAARRTIDADFGVAIAVPVAGDRYISRSRAALAAILFVILLATALGLSASRPPGPSVQAWAVALSMSRSSGATQALPSSIVSTRRRGKRYAWQRARNRRFCCAKAVR